MEEKENTLKKILLSIKKIGIDKLLLLALAGVALVLASIPLSKDSDSEGDNSANTTSETQAQESVTTYEAVLEQRIEKILGNIDGVGSVEVMITIKDQGEKIVDAETPYSKNDTKETDSDGGTRTITEITQSDTTIYTVDENGNSIPYVIKELEPEIEGVAVISEGASNAVIVQKITKVIESLLNVDATNISVMKMKS